MWRCGRWSRRCKMGRTKAAVLPVRSAPSPSHHGLKRWRNGLLGGIQSENSTPKIPGSPGVVEESQGLSDNSCGFPCAAFPGGSPQVYSIQPHPLWSHHERLRGNYPLGAAARLYSQPCGRLLQPACPPSRLPPEFADVYDAAAYQVAGIHPHVQTRFGILTSTCMLAVTLGFWFAGGFQALDVWVRSWHLGLIWTGLAYIGLLVLGRGLLAHDALRHVCHRSPLWV